jgi:hypothetical protein
LGEGEQQHERCMQCTCLGYDQLETHREMEGTSVCRVEHAYPPHECIPPVLE